MPRMLITSRGAAIGRAAIHEAFVARGTNTARHQIRTVAVVDDGVQYVIDGRVVESARRGDRQFLIEREMVARGHPNAVALLNIRGAEVGCTEDYPALRAGGRALPRGGGHDLLVSEVTASARVASAQVTRLLVYRHPPAPRRTGRAPRRVPDPSLAEDAVRRSSPIWNLVRWRLRQAVSRPTPCTATRRAAPTALAGLGAVCMLQRASDVGARLSVQNPTRLV